MNDLDRALAKLHRYQSDREECGPVGPDPEEPEQPQPIGHCPRCLAPAYTTEGFCGGCGYRGPVTP